MGAKHKRQKAQANHLLEVQKERLDMALRFAFLPHNPFFQFATLCFYALSTTTPSKVCYPYCRKQRLEAKAEKKAAAAAAAAASGESEMAPAPQEVAGKK
jgi:hypothetical protein